MKANLEELVLMLSTLTGLEVRPQGQETSAGVYITYLDIPGGVTAAYDGGGPYLVIYSLDVWARASDVYPDPQEAAFQVTEQIMAYIKPLTNWSVRAMPNYTAPNEDSGNYARASFKLITTYSF